MAPGFFLEDLEEIFQYEVLKMLKKEGKITDAVIENMLESSANTNELIRKILMIASLQLYLMRCLQKNSGKIGLD